MAGRRKKSAFRKVADYFTAAVLMIIVALAAAFFSDMGGKEYQGRFQVLDGDSLQQGEVRFRLEGIDAPEGQQTCGNSAKTWPCGREAAKYLRQRFASGSPVCRGTGTDRYARTLVRCTIGDSDINAEMVRRGWAVSYGLYQHEESEARREHAGIWVGEFTRPQDWREIHGSSDSPDFGKALAGWYERFGSWMRQWLGWWTGK
jgi:endonuclease YncB( thermonuclease family)